jgi:ABC-2 type transport system ATP-binding protein
MSDPTAVAVEVKNFTKRFVIRREKSLKERLVNFGRSQKHKEDFYALNDVSFEIEKGTTLGIIGPNGSGKSTLLKAIGGILQPTSGSVKHRGRIAALLELGAGFHPDLTGRENVYLNASIMGLSRAETTLFFDDIVDFSGVETFIDTQVKFYSSGMYVRLAFAVAVHVDPDILIIDEVLAVGDEPFQLKCLERIKEFQRAGKTIILVSHSLGQVGDTCDRVIVLRNGVVRFDGDPLQGINQLRDDFEEAADEMAAEEPEPERYIKIGSAGIELKTEQQRKSLGDGTALEVLVEIESRGPVRDISVGMSLETPLGQLVIGTNTERLRVAIPLVNGRLTVRFSLTGMRLAGGRYSLQAAVESAEGGEVARLRQAETFVVEPVQALVGIVAADVAVSVEHGSKTACDGGL